MIVLDRDEFRRAAMVGVDRRLAALVKKRRGAHGFNRDDFWRIDIEGACAEAAVAKFLGVPYDPQVGTLDTARGDVVGLDGIVQVRSTSYPDGHLLAHNTDADEHFFILVVGSQGRYELKGWRRGYELKAPSYWKVTKGRGAFWFPQHALLSMDNLKHRLDYPNAHGGVA